MVWKGEPNGSKEEHENGKKNLMNNLELLILFQ